MLQTQLGFVQHDNAFTQLDEPVQAQQLADRFPHLAGSRSSTAGPARSTHCSARPGSARPTITGSSTRPSTAPTSFSRVAPWPSSIRALLDHACLNFSAQDILTFLGRRLHATLRRRGPDRLQEGSLPGARIKHRVKNNWLKMYDKFGQILRIETVINQPREFKVRRRRLRGRGRSQMRWCPMNKGVANFYHYHEVAHAANERYLNALAVVMFQVPPPSKSTGSASRPFGQRRRRGLNLLRAEEQRLFRAVLRGD